MRKAGSPPSRFWVRLTEAFGERGLETSQIGVGRLVDRSQGSVARWYHGESLPRDMDTIRSIALKGKVTVDWLLTGRQPKYPIAKDPVLSKILEVAIELDDEARKEVLRTARKWQAQRWQGGH